MSCWKVGFSGDGPESFEEIQESYSLTTWFGESERNALRILIGFSNALMTLRVWFSRFSAKLLIGFSNVLMILRVWF